MSISDEIEKLKALYEAGTLSREEFELAKHQVLSGTARSDNLEELRIQNQIAQLDREWELERENYMATGKYGCKYIPGKVESLIGGIFIVCFGIFWTFTAASMTGFGAVGSLGFF
ncbi:MAG: SHOCT domain-containing protein [Cyanosarcina radialis HA8281-LM2]|jgi:hypothetical protein|nr:SHOCT domain-containing protein [Cyanosarcina radialis HA8281-LM2]